MKKITVQELCFIAICAALMAICAWIAIPISEISITLQTFGVFFALGILGGRGGTLSTLVYILLGAVGLPVFSNFRSTAALVGPTGGYILGFLGSALLYWLLTSLLGDKPMIRLISMVAGNLLCYALGTAWFAVVFFNRGTPMGLGSILTMCVIPYIPFDTLKIALAYGLSEHLRKIAPKIFKR